MLKRKKQRLYIKSLFFLFLEFKRTNKIRLYFRAPAAVSGVSKIRLSKFVC